MSQQAYPYDGWCGQAGYEPGDGQHYEQAWTLLGSCSGTLAPTTPDFGDLTNQGGCPSTYTASNTYEAGDKVSVSQIVYECKAWPHSGFCNSGGVYAPGDDHSDMGWTVLGYCSGTLAPTTHPNFGDLTNQGGCPSAYSASSTYGAGDKVSVSQIVYKCKAWPYSGFCNSGGVYAPGGDYSDMGWTVLGYCSGTLAPTTHPDFTDLTNQGGCPSAYSASSTYGAGDKVSVSQIVYECRAWPHSGYCNQYAPDSDLGDFGWTVLGYCSGTIAPTYMGINCPPPYVTGTSYKAGDQVYKAGRVYQCKPYPFYLWCSNPAYEPGMPMGVWADAWTLKGSC